MRTWGTLTEALLWECVRNRKMLGYRFLRQKIIGDYIVDFFCPKLRLVIEIDGTSHVGKKDYDKYREEYLNLNDLSIIRFRDCDVKNDMTSVLRAIESYIKKHLEREVPL